MRAALFAIDRQVDDSLAVPTTELNAINKEHERLDGIAAGMLNGPSKGTAKMAVTDYDRRVAPRIASLNAQIGELSALLEPTKRFWDQLVAGRGERGLPIVQTDEYIAQVQEAIAAAKFGGASSEPITLLAEEWVSPPRARRAPLTDAVRQVEETQERVSAVLTALRRLAIEDDAREERDAERRAGPAPGTPPPANALTIWHLRF